MTRASLAIDRPAGTPLRAPAAGVFYQATAATPQGVVRRRAHARDRVEPPFDHVEHVLVARVGAQLLDEIGTTYLAGEHWKLPDVVVTDLKMPVRDGYQFFDYILRVAQGDLEVAIAHRGDDEVGRLAPLLPARSPSAWGSPADSPGPAPDGGVRG